MYQLTKIVWLVQKNRNGKCKTSSVLRLPVCNPPRLEPFVVLHLTKLKIPSKTSLVCTAAAACHLYGVVLRNRSPKRVTLPETNEALAPLIARLSIHIQTQGHTIKIWFHYTLGWLIWPVTGGAPCRASVGQQPQHHCYLLFCCYSMESKSIMI